MSDGNIIEQAIENADHVHEVRQEAIYNYIEKITREFVEYVIGEAGATAIVPEFGVDAVQDAAHELHQNGYDYAPDDETGEVTTYIFATPKLYDNLRQHREEWIRSEGIDSEGGHGHQNVAGIEVYADKSVPEDMAVAVHHDAIAPNLTMKVRRPWLVRDPKGVVAIEVESDD